MKLVHLFLPIFPTFGRFQSLFILPAAFPLYHVAKLLHFLIPSLTLSPIGDDLTLEVPLYFAF